MSAVVVGADALAFYVSNKCDNILAADNIGRKQFATVVGHLTHSLYLEPLRFVFYLPTHKPELMELASSIFLDVFRFALILLGPNSNKHLGPHFVCLDSEITKTLVKNLCNKSNYSKILT